GSGSSNVMEHLGYQFTSNPDQLKKNIDNAGICFLHAPLFNPAMKTIAPIRKELAVKTFFNMLGPMVNPAKPKNQLVGVFSLELARIYNYLYQKSDKNYTIVHALDGYDEISLTCNFKTFSNTGEQIYQLNSLGFTKLDPAQISSGHTVPEAAAVFTSVLNDEATEAQTNVVLCNAAMAIRTIDPEKSFAACFEEASVSLQDKKALNSFKKLLQN
ncbi:MAG: anthranilate phosphoribosyltransferase, partial [Sphingobacteriaceae bacterium]